MDLEAALIPFLIRNGVEVQIGLDVGQTFRPRDGDERVPALTSQAKFRLGLIIFLNPMVDVPAAADQFLTGSFTGLIVIRGHGQPG